MRGASSMKRSITVVVVMLLSSANVAGVTLADLTGRVVDKLGKPVAGARVAERWFVEQTAPLEPNRPARTDADGRFSLELKLYGRGTTVMAIDSSCKDTQRSR
jgi:hypothetical protein